MLSLQEECHMSIYISMARNNPVTTTTWLLCKTIQVGGYV